jgi:murein DD-endopeptidase MepM/ murein hydrolase activator NlpD
VQARTIRPFKAQVFAPTTIVATFLTFAHLIPGGAEGVASRVAALFTTKKSSEVAESRAAQPAPLQTAALDFEAHFQPAHFQLDPFAGAQRAESNRLARVTVDLDDGDTITSLLTHNDVSADEARAVIEAMKPAYDVRKARAGQSFTLLFDRSQPQSFQGIEFDPDAERSVTVLRTNGGVQFAAATAKRPLASRTVAARGTIRSSLFEAAANAAVPQPVLQAMIKAFSYDVDFQRDLQPGDKFEVMYDVQMTQAGEPVRAGDVLYASLILSGKQKQIYGYRHEDGTIDYYDRTGKSVRKSLLRTPIDGAKLTSAFGMRRHPLLGFTRMHKGVDFGAPQGTPVYAAGDGTIETAGWAGGYGRLVKIRHNGQMVTAYGHLSRFAANVQAGARVRQGQVIAYVGTTGNSTGPHLHYEVIKGGEQVNPNNTMLPAGNNLEGRDLVAFAKVMNDRETQIASIGNGLLLASARATVTPVACRADSPC